jgi:hypothetical protein
MAPEYGVFAATLKPLTREGRLANIIHFWPAHVNDGTLSFGLGLYHLIQPYELSAVGASGRYVVVWVREGKDYLGLLHLCVTPTPHTTFRKLDTGSLCLSSLSRIALDDSLGLVLVVDDTGRITATSYM